MFSVLAVSAVAESAETETLKVGVEATAATPVSSTPQIFNFGEEVSVRVTISQNTGITFLRFAVILDDDALEYVSHESKGLLGANEIITVKDGKLIYLADLSDSISDATGELFDIKFKTKSVCGKTEIRTSLEGRPANCAKYQSSSKNTPVTFVGESVTFSVHNIVSDGEVTVPTCLEEGYTTFRCSACDEYVKGNIVSALGHDLIHHEAKAPTCTEIGWDAYDTCARCDYSTYVEISALDHDLIHHEAKAPNCTEIGWDAYDTCTRCKYTTYVEKPALGHDLIHHEAKAPTCTEIGWDAYDTCARCDYSTYAEISALDHDLIHHEAKAPTCTEIGWDAYDTCTRCKYTTYVEKPALGHTYGESTVVKPGYKQEGYTFHTCEVCGNEEKYDIIPALTYVLGDVNGDEEVDISDAMKMFYHIAKKEFLSDEQLLACDIDGNGTVDVADVMRVFYFVAKKSPSL